MEEGIDTQVPVPEIIDVLHKHKIPIALIPDVFHRVMDTIHRNTVPYNPNLPNMKEKMQGAGEYSIILRAKIKHLKKYKRKAKKLCKHLKRAKSLADEMALIELKAKVSSKSQSSR